MELDIRWKQRFANFKKAFNHLEEAVVSYNQNPPDIIKEGIIQRFEFTHELGWKVMKDFLEYEGITNIIGSRSATREAFNKGIISDGQVWMDMIESRNKTVHTYEETILQAEFEKIISIYYPSFKAFYITMQGHL